MLDTNTLKYIKTKKNLLAFSAGGDSTALLFLLKKEQIDFDIAIVDYGVREQSKDEVSYAKSLAKEYNFNCHIFKASKIENNFEAKARELRYKFFYQLISKYKYNNLLTAHHLGDRFEWMLMQFCKGSGCIELSGMQTIEQRDGFKLIRPLLHLDKHELLEFLHNKNIKYFEDESNKDEKYKRNIFRHKYTKPLLKEYLSGIKKSFQYIDEDRNTLTQDIKVHSIDNFTYFKSSGNKRADIFNIDKYIKSNLYLISASERKALKNSKTIILGRKFIVNQEHNFVFIAPYLYNKNAVMTKEFKERMRILRIEPKLRYFLYKHPKALRKVEELLI